MQDTFFLITQAVLGTFLVYCFMLWGMCGGPTGDKLRRSKSDRLGDTIGFLIFAAGTYSIAVFLGLIIASFYM